MKNAVDLFQNYNLFMKRLNKKVYKKTMDDFNANNGDFFVDLLARIEADEDKIATAKSIGGEFASNVYESFAKFGKISSSRKADLSMYMIYYIFPAILATGRDDATLLCDSIRDAWNEQFGSKIDYTDFDSLYSGFRDKLFGLF